MTFQEWLEIGLALGWVSEPDCYPHNGIDMTRGEMKARDMGEDPCIVVMRVWA